MSVNKIGLHTVLLDFGRNLVVHGFLMATFVGYDSLVIRNFCSGIQIGKGKEIEHRVIFTLKSINLVLSKQVTKPFCLLFIILHNISGFIPKSREAEREHEHYSFCCLVSHKVCQIWTLLTRKKYQHLLTVCLRRKHCTSFL